MGEGEGASARSVEEGRGKSALGAAFAETTRRRMRDDRVGLRSAAANVERAHDAPVDRDRDAAEPAPFCARGRKQMVIRIDARDVERNAQLDRLALARHKR